MSNYLNPENLPPDDNGLLPESIVPKTALFFQKMSMVMGLISMLGVFLISDPVCLEPQNKPDKTKTQNEDTNTSFKLDGKFWTYFVAGVCRCMFLRYFTDDHKILGMKYLKDDRLVTTISSASTSIRLVSTIFTGWIFARFQAFRMHLIIYVLVFVNIVLLLWFPLVKSTFIINVYFAYFLAGFNSTLNAQTMYSIYPESEVLKANSVYVLIYTTYNFIISQIRQMVSDPLDYRTLAKIFAVFNFVGLAVLLKLPRNKKSTNLKIKKK
jgi:hypothetical protein